MDTNIIVALIGLIGVSLGALLSGIGYFLKVRSERLKTKNNVLFHLLEIRHLIRSEYVDSDELSGKYLDYCGNYFSRKGLNSNIEISPELKKFIESHFQSLSEAIRPLMDSGFVKSLNSAVAALAIDNPTLAFKLRGKERVNDLLEAQNQYIDSFDKVAFNNETPDFIKQAASSHAVRLNRDVIGDFIKDIDADIRLVSRGAGVLTYIAVRKILRDIDKKEVDFNMQEYDPIMDEILAVMVDAANKSSQQDVQKARASA